MLERGSRPNLLDRSWLEDLPEAERTAALQRFAQRMIRSFIALTVVIVVALAAQALTISRLSSVSNDQREGRRVAIRASCVVASSIIDAGRLTIQTSSTISPRRFERELEKIGLPSRAEREKAATIASVGYAQAISSAVQAAGLDKTLVNQGGTLDCRKLEQAANANP